MTNIPYDNAKAINRTYLREKRVNKINYRLRYQKKSLSSLSSRKASTEFEVDRDLSHESSPTNYSSDINNSAVSLGSSDHFPQVEESLTSSFEHLR